MMVFCGEPPENKRSNFPEPGNTEGGFRNSTLQRFLIKIRVAKVFYWE